MPTVAVVNDPIGLAEPAYLLLENTIMIQPTLAWLPYHVLLPTAFHITVCCGTPFIVLKRLFHCACSTASISIKQQYEEQLQEQQQLQPRPGPLAGIKAAFQDPLTVEIYSIALPVSQLNAACPPSLLRSTLSYF